MGNGLSGPCQWPEAGFQRAASVCSVRLFGVVWSVMSETMKANLRLRLLCNLVVRGERAR